MKFLIERILSKIIRPVLLTVLLLPICKIILDGYLLTNNALRSSNMPSVFRNTERRYLYTYTRWLHTYDEPRLQDN